MVKQLEYWFSKSSDCSLHHEYIKLLNELLQRDLDQETVNYLCEKATSKKHWCEIRSDHVKILLLNKTACNYDLKQFYYENFKRTRRLWFKLYFIRGYAIYASEAELSPIMTKFQELLRKNHDYIDYEFILSAAGLPYLVKTYGYPCFAEALETAKNEYEKIDPLLRGYFTFDENMEQIHLLTNEEVHRRAQEFLTKCRQRPAQLQDDA